MRYLPLTPTDRRDMLGVIGANSVDELFKDVPASARLRGKPVPAEIVPMPFVKHAYYRG